MQDHTYRIRAVDRRTGEVVEGTTIWDGLSSLHPVERADGSYAYISVLDTIEVFERVERYEGEREAKDAVSRGVWEEA